MEKYSVAPMLCNRDLQLAHFSLFSCWSRAQELSPYLPCIPWITGVRLILLGQSCSQGICVTRLGSSFLVLRHQRRHLFSSPVSASVLSVLTGLCLLCFPSGLSRGPLFFLSPSLEAYSLSSSPQTQFCWVTGFSLLIYAWGKAAVF